MRNLNLNRPYSIFSSLFIHGFIFSFAYFFADKPAQIVKTSPIYLKVSLKDKSVNTQDTTQKHQKVEILKRAGNSKRPRTESFAPPVLSQDNPSQLSTLKKEKKGELYKSLVSLNLSELGFSESKQGMLELSLHSNGKKEMDVWSLKPHRVVGEPFLNALLYESFFEYSKEHPLLIRKSCVAEKLVSMTLKITTALSDVRDNQESIKMELTTNSVVFEKQVRSRYWKAGFAQNDSKKNPMVGIDFIGAASLLRSESDRLKSASGSQLIYIERLKRSEAFATDRYL